MSKLFKTSYLYTLHCPDNGCVMYVGKSDSPYVRRIYHMQHSAIHTNPWLLNPVNVWIKELLLLGKKPDIQIIGECDYLSVFCLERFWIKYYLSLNPLLLNDKHNPNIKNNTYYPIRERNFEYKRVKL